MKKLKSLALAFALAVGGVAGVSSVAQAQTVSPVSQGITVSAQDYVSNNYVAPEVVDAVSQLPMNTAYHRAGLGFTAARVDQTGENVGIEYSLTGGQKIPVRVYNLDDGTAAMQWRQSITNAIATENQLTAREMGIYRYRPTPTIYYPAPYVYVRPVQPVIFVGPVFRSSGHYHVVHHVNQRQHFPAQRHNRGNGHRH